MSARSNSIPVRTRKSLVSNYIVPDWNDHLGDKHQIARKRTRFSKSIKLNAKHIRHKRAQLYT